MSNIIIGSKTYNGVNTIRVKDTNNQDVDFNENPFIIDSSQAPDESYVGKLCKDATTGQEYIVTRGNSESFVLNNLPVSDRAGVKCLYANNTWVILLMTSSSVAVYYSTDGLNWNYSISVGSSFDSGGNNANIIYGDGKWVLFGLSGKYIYYTGDLSASNWSSYQFTGTEEAVKCMAYGNGRFIAFSTYGSSTTSYKLYYSTTLSSWTSLGGYNVYSLFFVNGYFHRVSPITVSNTTYTAFYKSLDGTSWIEEFERIQTSSSRPNCMHLLYVEGTYYFNYSSTRSLTISPSGTTWTQIGSFPFTPYAYIYVNQTFYIGTQNGKIYKSADAITWTQLDFTSENGYITTMDSDGSIIIGLFSQYPGAWSIATFSNYVISDSSNNLYYRPIYY